MGREEELAGVECEEGVENWFEVMAGDSWFQGGCAGDEGTAWVSEGLADERAGIPEGVVLFFFLFFLGDRLSEEGWSWLRFVPENTD